MCMRTVHVQAKQTRTSVRREALVACVILVSEHRVVVRLAGVGPILRSAVVIAATMPCVAR
jgi:hypothetical protein